MKHLAALMVLGLAACGPPPSNPPHPDRIEYHFKACMKEARDGSLLARMNSPVDECEDYAWRQAKREANP